MLDQVEFCPCGRLLHYTNPEAQAAVERINEEVGPTVKVTMRGRSWLIPRHYIALHGLKADRIEALDFEEV